MNKSVDFELTKKTRTYILRVYTNETQTELFSKESFPLCSLYIKDQENKVSNKQPLNKSEVAFRKGSEIEKIIANLALNYDVDLSTLKDINNELIEIVKSEKVVDVPEGQSKGVLPLF